MRAVSHRRRIGNPKVNLKRPIDIGAHLGSPVFDFIRLHVIAGGIDHDWYVFNLADAAIVAGVAALLYESVRPDRAAKVP